MLRGLKRPVSTRSWRRPHAARHVRQRRNRTAIEARVLVDARAPVRQRRRAGLHDVFSPPEHWFCDVVSAAARRCEPVLPGPRPIAARGATRCACRASAAGISSRGSRSASSTCRAPVFGRCSPIERYQPVWKDDRCLDPLLDAGRLSIARRVCARRQVWASIAEAARKLTRRRGVRSSMLGRPSPRRRRCRPRVDCFARKTRRAQQSRAAPRNAPRAVLGLS